MGSKQDYFNLHLSGTYLSFIWFGTYQVKMFADEVQLPQMILLVMYTIVNLLHVLPKGYSEGAFLLSQRKMDFTQSSARGHSSKLTLNSMVRKMLRETQDNVRSFVHRILHTNKLNQKQQRRINNPHSLYACKSTKQAQLDLMC